jgi:UDP-N-acetylmuramate dehydrogenase
MGSAESLEKLLGPEIRFNVPLAPLSTMGVGGLASFFYQARRTEELIKALKLFSARNVNFHVIGGGSNVIIDDRGLNGLVISTLSCDQMEIRVEDDTVFILADAGVQMKRLLAFAVTNGFSGLEFAIGLPGTLGGALYGNAGVRESVISDVVSWIETYDSPGEIRRRSREELKWGYRYSELSDESGMITRCCLKLKRSTPGQVKELARSYWKKRVHQPYGYKSAGCVFRNPYGYSAGRLLEKCGCKGLKEGNAQVSQFHANFIVNLGGASFMDILKLMRKCRCRVMDNFGISLCPEVSILSENDFQI